MATKAKSDVDTDVKKEQVDEELEAVRKQYPADAVVYRNPRSGNIRVQLKDASKAGFEQSGVQRATPARPNQNTGG